MSDIALGLADKGLEAFAADRNASYMSQWRDLGLYDDNAEGWGEAFAQVVMNTLAIGGRIHFNLTGLNILEALAGDPQQFVGRYTSYELQQIVRNRRWFLQCTFYLHGRSLTLEDLASLGITQPPA
jgi:hypothetical protein